MATLYLCGAGNPEGVRLALTINRSQDRWDRIIILDDDSSKHGQSILDIEIVGPFTELEKADPTTDEVSNLVARTTAARRSAMEKIKKYGVPFATMIDPGVDMIGVEFARDITVYRNAHFCANATVEEGLIVFAGGIIGHGCHLGRCCIVAPGAVVNARVEVGDGVYVGTNASILPDLKIGSSATIGSNSAVVQDVPAGATVMGVPAQLIMTEIIESQDEVTDGHEGKQKDYLSSPDSIEEQLGSTGIRSEALRKLRIAQERYMKDYRSTKT